MVMTALTPKQFRKYLVRRKAKESMAAIGRDLGVSRQAVKQWIDGDTDPSNVVLLVAAMHMKMESGTLRSTPTK